MQKVARKLGRVPALALLVIVALLAMACSGLATPDSPEAAVTAKPTSVPERTVLSGDSRTDGTRRSRRDNDIKFEQISLEQGLSQSVVMCILQDSRGFMWFGTQDGLNRYDGYEFVVYKHDPENPHSLSNDFVLSIYEDRSGVLWVGTNGGGLNGLDRETGRFVHYLNILTDTHSLSNNVILSIGEDRERRLWVGTNGGGLNRFDRETRRFSRYQNVPDDTHSLSNDVVTAIYRDREDTLWIGTGGGLNRWDQDVEQFIRYQSVITDVHSLGGNNVQAIYQGQEGELWIGTFDGGLSRFDRETEQFARYRNIPGNPHSLSSNAVQSVYVDRSGALWIGTNNAGLNRFDREMKQFVHYQNDPADPHSLSINNVLSVYEDRTGGLWVGTFGGGLDKYDRSTERFVYYRANPNDPHSLNSNLIWSFYEDQAGVLWVGTFGGGLNRFDRGTGRWRHYQNEFVYPHSLSSNNVTVVYQDRESVLWVGTLGGGLNKFDRGTERFTRYQNVPADPHSLSGNNVLSIYQDREGVLWLGTNGGLNRFDRETERFTSYQNVPTDTHSLSNNVVAAIHQDREGVLWVGTSGGGLNRFDRETEQFISYQNIPGDAHSLSNNNVLSIYQDREGVLWLGTFGGGLNKFDRATETFTHYREKDGLPNDKIYGILEDDQGNLWLSTNGGLSRFDPRTETFRNYDVRDGLQSNEFNMGAYHKSSSGEMFFGGINGFNVFYPDNVKDNPYIPYIVITDFKLFNESVGVGDDSPLEKSIEETDVIELSYEEDFFSFEFAALHYTDPEENQYAYMMEGLDKGWNHVGTRRFAGYTSVPPGEYTFRVKGSNSDGVWNEEGAAIRIVIPPPFWETWWFRVLVGMLVVGGVLGAVTWRIRSIEAQRRRLEILVDERTKELRDTLVELERAKEAALEAQRAAEAASRAKSVFLASVSHELRTPLNAILGFTQLMNRDIGLSTEQRENLGIINRSGEHLLGLINDVLDLSKIEAGRAMLNERDFDLHHLLDGLEEMFRLRAENKDLMLTFDRASDVPQYVRTDEGKLRQVLMNLLGNAVKFTQEGGVVLRVRVVILSPSQAERDERQWLLFEVEDTGPGIAPEELEAVFDPFVQTKTGQQSPEGTGLGLPISQQFARLMGGGLSMSSELGQGSIFRFEVPVEVVDASAVRAVQPSRRVIGLEPGQPTYRLLIVDDGETNRKLLVKLLAPLGFEVREAVNGREAIEIWERWEPHLIWMDMRMPVMDGYEATRRIKATTKGQATVIIALTASALEEDRAIILSEGCDGYIRKPFREAELFNALTEHLGVRFVYEELETREPTQDVLGYPVPRGPDAALVEELTTMPTEWVADLHRATVKADWNMMLTLINRIRGENAALADALVNLARNFEYREILMLIQQAGGQE
ncbi:MAG: two-component regulator propeller domain-containing protein [Promethearchaeota archaeon]